jgi:hypothetical protein
MTAAPSPADDLCYRPSRHVPPPAPVRDAPGSTTGIRVVRTPDARSTGGGLAAATYCGGAAASTRFVISHLTPRGQA